MARGMKVFGGVLALRLVAAAHVPAGDTQAQVDPTIAGLQALFAAIGVGLDVANLV
jgi:hypothetical protein